MKILAFELSSAQGSIALMEAGQPLFERTFPNDRKDSGAFFESVQDCQERFGPPGEIVVGIGPGSYAGARIAIATAIGLRTATSATLVGIPSICALEVEAPDYCVIGDARRQSFFFARVSDGRLIEGPILETSEELQTRLSVVTVPVFSSEQLPQFPRVELAYPRARRLAQIASTQPGEIADAQDLEPIYLRPPHITVPRASRSPVPTQ